MGILFIFIFLVVHLSSITDYFLVSELFLVISRRFSSTYEDEFFWWIFWRIFLMMFWQIFLMNFFWRIFWRIFWWFFWCSTFDLVSLMNINFGLQFCKIHFLVILLHILWQHCYLSIAVIKKYVWFFGKNELSTHKCHNANLGT